MEAKIYVDINVVCMCGSTLKATFDTKWNEMTVKPCSACMAAIQKATMEEKVKS